MAARRALKLALETVFDRVILEGDSQILTTALETSPHPLSHFGRIAKETYNLTIIHLTSPTFFQSHFVNQYVLLKAFSFEINKVSPHPLFRKKNALNLFFVHANFFC